MRWFSWGLEMALWMAVFLIVMVVDAIIELQ